MLLHSREQSSYPIKSKLQIFLTAPSCRHNLHWTANQRRQNLATKWKASVPLSATTLTMILISCSYRCAPFFPLNITLASLYFYSHLFHFPLFIPPHFTLSPRFHELPPLSPLLHLSENQTTAPQPTRDCGNPLSTIVEICHLGADVTSDLVGREGCRRAAMEKGRYAAVPRWDKVGIGMGVTYKGLPSTRSITHTHTHKHTAVEP